MLKNRVFQGASHTLGVPANPSSIGPDAPVSGQTRYNTTTGKLEFYANITGTPSWNAVSREGNVVITRDNFTGNAVAVQFWPLSTNFTSGQENQVIVHVGTVYQIPTTNYTFDGTGNIQFISPPSGSSDITIIHGFASTISTLA